MTMITRTLLHWLAEAATAALLVAAWAALLGFTHWITWFR